VGAFRLPLFPLQLVMFPGARIPLHIFEERYRTLMNECIRAESEFGITLFADGELSNIGCTAVVSSVRKRYADGRMDIIAEGRRRFRLLSHETGPQGYLIGTAEILSTEGAPANQSLADETIRLYNTLVALVYKNKIEPVEVGSKDSHLSFLLAQKAGLDLPQRQQILESPSEVERLTILRDYLTQVLPKLERASEIERIIRSDGYLPRHSSEGP